MLINLNLQCLIDLEKTFPRRNLKLVSLRPKTTLDICFKNYINLSLYLNPLSLYLNPTFLFKHPRIGFDLQLLCEKSVYKKPNLVLKWNLFSFRAPGSKRFFINRLGCFYIGIGKNGYNCLLNTDLANIFLEQMTNRYFLVEAPLIKIYPRKSSKLLNKYSFSKDSKERFLFAQPPVQDTSNEVEITVKPKKLNSMKFEFKDSQYIQSIQLPQYVASITQKNSSINQQLNILHIFFVLTALLFKILINFIRENKK
uniref:Uncharacterized protein n=1 Tax=Avrainvillea mazei TaxID=381412 RepID=A0A1X9RPT4_9CHLO|nr:hypothetical protein [Avrainvillea mazei]